MNFREQMADQFAVAADEIQRVPINGDYPLKPENVTEELQPTISCDIIATEYRQIALELAIKAYGATSDVHSVLKAAAKFEAYLIGKQNGNAAE